VQHVAWLCWCASVEHKDDHGYGEGQVDMGRVDGLGAVKDKREAWPRDQDGRKTDRG
jgi:hypothetical protein